MESNSHAHDMLRYLISYEWSASAFLAMVLDRGSDSCRAWQESFRKRFADLCKIELSPAGPHSIALEEYGFDVLALWDEWAVVIEAKITAGALRAGQLQANYEKACDLLKRKHFKSASRILMVFVTPKDIGGEEFQRLKVDGNAKAHHLHWEDLVHYLKENVPSLPLDDASFFCGLVARVAPRLLALLEEKRQYGLIQWTPERRECQKFTHEVQDFVRERFRHPELRFNPRWSGREFDEVSANFGGERAGNVYFRVYSNAVISYDEHGEAVLKGCLFFKVTQKGRRSKSAVFLELVKSEFATRLRLPDTDWGDLHTDEQQLQVSWKIDRTGMRADLVHAVASAFCSFLETFRPIMI